MDLSTAAASLVNLSAPPAPAATTTANLTAATALNIEDGGITTQRINVANIAITAASIAPPTLPTEAEAAAAHQPHVCNDEDLPIEDRAVPPITYDDIIPSRPTNNYAASSGACLRAACDPDGLHKCNVKGCPKLPGTHILHICALDGCTKLVHELCIRNSLGKSKPRCLKYLVFLMRLNCLHARTNKNEIGSGSSVLNGFLCLSSNKRTRINPVAPFRILLAAAIALLR